MITLEICNYFGIKNNNIHLSNIRARTKLLDDNKINIEETIYLHNRILEDHHNYFNRSHKGFIRRLIKHIQPDIGVFEYNGNFIGTTTLYNFYLSKSSSNTPIHELSAGKSHDIGYNLGALLGELEEKINFKDPSIYENIKSIEIEGIAYKDYKANKYYKNLFSSSLPKGVVHLLLSLIAPLNFSYYVLSHERIDEKVSFKIKYLIVYHVLSSIKKLQGYFYKNNLISESSKDIFSEILSDKEVKLLLSSRKFRNILVHYELRNINTDKISEELVLNGIIEQCHNKLSYKELSDIVNSQTLRISSLLISWKHS